MGSDDTTTRLRLTVATASDPGLKRPGNEDCHAVWLSEAADESGQGEAILVVADGMGGSLSGEVASRLAVDAVVEVLRASRRDDVIADLRRAIEEANRRVHEKSLSHPDLSGMGTTCTVVVVRGSVAWVGHVGDSRAYLIRGEQIRQLTNDHSLVARLVERREITRAQARRDPRRNIVTRSIGPAETVEADVFKTDVGLRAGDKLLVCSDGLYGLFHDSELADLVTEGDKTTVCIQLIAEANDRGGPDNITVVVAWLHDAWETSSEAGLDQVREA